MIDLLSLAKKADELYIDVETTFGTIRVYHVPDVVLLSVGVNRPEPELPEVRMRTATGWQTRQAKAGDDEYQQWLEDRASYEQELLNLRSAIGIVSALKDVDWSKYDLSTPPPVKSAIELYADGWPDDEVLRKKAWLDWTILMNRADNNAILAAMNYMNSENEPTSDMVDSVKKNSD